MSEAEHEWDLKHTTDTPYLGNPESIVQIRLLLNRHKHESCP